MATIAKTKNLLKPWRVQIRRKGQPSQSKYFATNADAKRWAREQEAHADKNPHASTGLRLTYAQLTETYIEKIIGPPPEGAEPKAVRDKRRLLRLIAKEMGPVRVAEMRCRFSRRTDPGFSLRSDPPFYVPWVSFESRHSISPSGF